MALEDRNRRGLKRLFRSFNYAISGLGYVIRHEQNMQIHLASTMAICGLAWFFSVSATEWVLLLLVMGGVLTAETLNTAIERTVDLVTEDFHPLAKRAKDIGAASVFIFCIIAIIIGAIIFVPYFINIL
ncbi:MULTISPECIES: diacylglycerol kinase family protein [Shouchella]|uniref:Diacylglycerol kinase family protein n=2 Tax=Shouchella TaxID=2893057 RepID=A0ABY7W264_9BACI|nr:MULTISPECIES: diacylglycerol kinase family protein [Shouchella]MED4127886.1 diacylglycerol kinase family protein [Shouchella miscanthi]WDF03035.1 diacylglycerol kinase family protein [Shouchella hunanensis]GAF22951.1 diacylglycerol kinase [Bacillus sp. JCM 19047]